MDGWMGGWMGGCGCWPIYTYIHTHAKHADFNCEWLSPLSGWLSRLEISQLVQDLFYFNDLT